MHRLHYATLNFKCYIRRNISMHEKKDESISEEETPTVIPN